MLLRQLGLIYGVGRYLTWILGVDGHRRTMNITFWGGSGGVDFFGGGGRAIL